MLSERRFTASFIASKPLCVRSKSFPENMVSAPGEPLDLAEAHPALAQRLDRQGVFAVEDAGDQKSTHPTDLLIGLDLADVRPEAHRTPARRLDRDPEASAFAQLAFGMSDERVPVLEAAEIGQHGPHALGRGVNVNGRVELLHHLTVREE